MLEPRVHSCLFGCRDVQDDLSHYLRCERFWRALKSALKATSTTGPLATNAPMLEKLAITATSERLVCNLCALSHGYHTLKANYRDAFLHASAAQIAQTSIDVLKSAVLQVRAMLPFPRVSPAVLPVPPGFPAASRADQSIGCDPRAVDPQRAPVVGMRPPSEEFSFELQSDTIDVTEYAGRWELCDNRNAQNGDGFRRNNIEDVLYGREFCEPECSDLAPGEHHPSCSMATLLPEIQEAAENRDRDMSACLA